MKKLVSALGLFALLALVGATFAPRATAAPAPSPKVIAAVFYADWCGYCKKMAPASMATMKAYKGDNAVKFVKLDLTNDKTNANSTKVAMRNGILPVWKGHQETGIILLIDGKTRKVIGKIDSNDSSADMKAKIEAAKSGEKMSAAEMDKMKDTAWTKCTRCKTGQPKNSGDFLIGNRRYFLYRSFRSAFN